MKIKAFVLGYVVLAACAASAETGGNLEIEVRKIRNTSGQLRVSLFNKPEGFPMDHSKAFRTGILQITNQTMKVVFDGLKPGTYAVAVHHDENSNDRLDTNIFGVPREGVGASNDATAGFGPPGYEDAKFDIKGEGHLIRINMKYWIGSARRQ